MAASTPEGDCALGALGSMGRMKAFVDMVEMRVWDRGRAARADLIDKRGSMWLAWSRVVGLVQIDAFAKKCLELSSAGKYRAIRRAGVFKPLGES